MGKLFLQAYRWIANRKWTSLFIILAFAAGLIALSSRVQFEDDITALIPANEETKRIQKVLKSISFTDKIIVTIQKSEEASTVELTQYASAFIDSLETKHSEFVESVFKFCCIMDMIIYCLYLEIEEFQYSKYNELVQHN